MEAQDLSKIEIKGATFENFYLNGKQFDGEQEQTEKEEENE